MISKLAPGMTNVNLTAEVVCVEGVRKVRTRYGKKRVCNATLKDDTGEISLTLWGEQIDLIREGDTVNIAGGYVTEWKGEFQVNIPKKGIIEKKE